jgi:hypothetical protein
MPTEAPTNALEASSTPQPTTTPLPSQTPAPQNQGGTSTPTTSASGAKDSAAFVSDVTIPDGTPLKAGEAFTKTWRLKNSGLSTWTTAYTVYFVSGTQMGAPQSSPLPGEVKPGDEVDISLQMTAPTAPGNYTGVWMLKNAAGISFGVGSGGNETFYLMITVAGGAGTPAATAAVTATVGSGTPQPTSGTMKVTSVNLSIDKATYSGTCPVTLTLSGSITSEGAGAITYQLEGENNTPKFTLTLPGPQTANFNAAGTRTMSVVFTLDLSGSMSGKVRLLISAPNTVRSGDVTFTVTCK